MVMTCDDRGVVDVVDHAGQRRALAAAGGAGDQDQAALFLGDALEDRRQPQFVDALDPERDDAEDHADGAALLEHVAAEAAQARHAVGEVDFLRVLEALALGGGHDRRRHLHEVLVVQPLLLGDARQPPVHAHHREAADLQVQVRGAFVDGEFQQVVDMHG